MRNEGWIKLHRRFLEWEWYNDSNVVRVFLHCLLKANHEDRKYRGEQVKRGEFLTGRKEFSNEVSLSVQQVRTAFNKLQKTGEITIESTSKGSRVTVCNYNTYQKKEAVDNQQYNQRPTNDQPTSNQQVTTNKNDNNYKNDKNEPRELNYELEAVPKDLEEVIKFFENMQSTDVEAKSFFYHYDSQNWEKSSGMKITSWRQAAKKWIHENRTSNEFKKDVQPEPIYFQRLS